MTTHQQTLQLANSFPLWLFCFLVLGLVLAQTGILIHIGKQYFEHAGITRLDVHHSVKSGLIATLGPAFSIFVIGLGLIAQIGEPMTLARLSVIGNAIYETSAAEMGAAAMGTSINADDYSREAYVCSVWVMNLGGICMILPTILFIKPLAKMTHKIEEKNNHTGVIIAAATSIASIGCFTAEYAMEDLPGFVAVASAFAITAALTFLSNKKRIPWLKDWSIAIAIVVAVICVLLVL